MFRATVRFSINHELQGVTRTAVVKSLEYDGFSRAGTATWEHPAATFADASAAVKRALDILEQSPGGGEPDHVWVYVCHTPEDVPIPDSGD